MLINDPNHSFSDFSKTTNENTRQFGVHTVFESSVSQRSRDDFALQACNREPVAGQRIRRERRFSDQYCRIHVKRDVDGTTLGCHSLQTNRKFFSDGRDLPEHLGRDPDLLSSCDIPTFSSSNSYYLEFEESRATKLEMSFPGNVLLDNMLNENLMSYTIIPEIWEHIRNC